MLTKCLGRENLELFPGSRQKVFADLCLKFLLCWSTNWVIIHVYSGSRHGKVQPRGESKNAAPPPPPGGGKDHLLFLLLTKSAAPPKSSAPGIAPRPPPFVWVLC